MIKGHIIAALLCQQQPGVPNNHNTAEVSAPAGQPEFLLRGINVNANATPIPGQMSHCPPAAAAAYSRPSPQQSPQNANGSVPCFDNADLSKEGRWMMRYEDLKRFRKEHGHCRVPHGYTEHRKLSWWVMNQRAQYQLLKQGKKTWLTPERVELLNGIGFEWNPRIGKSTTNT